MTAGPDTAPIPPRGRWHYREWLKVGQQTLQRWGQMRVPKMGAALAYYTACSLAPLLILILSIASLVVRKDFAREQVLNQVTALIGPKGTAAIGDILNHASSPLALSWQTAISFIILFISASGAFGELQDSLNQIWDAPVQKHPVRNFFRGRALSFAMVWVLGFFMLVSLVISAALAGVGKYLFVKVPVFALESVNFLVSTTVIGCLFAVIFSLLPAVRLHWRDIWPGALLSSVLFGLGKFLLGWYLGRGNFASTYGAAGSFIIILVWVFYSAQILFLGAVFNRVLLGDRPPTR